MYGPRGVAHTFWNPGREPVRYLVVMTPNTLLLIEEIHRLPTRDAEAVRALYRQYHCELLG